MACCRALVLSHRPSRTQGEASSLCRPGFNLVFKTSAVVLCFSLSVFLLLLLLCKTFSSLQCADIIPDMDSSLLALHVKAAVILYLKCSSCSASVGVTDFQWKHPWRLCNCSTVMYVLEPSPSSDIVHCVDKGLPATLAQVKVCVCLAGWRVVSVWASERSGTQYGDCQQRGTPITEHYFERFMEMLVLQHVK